MAEHGTHAHYSIGGCRCFPCRQAHYEYNSYRDKQIAYGRWNRWAEADPVREHVRSLMAQGIGWRRIALFADINVNSLNRILYAKPVQKRIRLDIAEKLLAVQPSLEAIGCTTAIDATGTKRRLQALVAVGWSQAKIGARLGINATNVGRMLGSDRVTAGSARSVRDLYERMWNEAPPEEDWRDKIAANRARGYATERGWAPPMAWDENIEDPAAEPEGVGSDKRRGKLPCVEDLEWLVQGGDSIEVLAARYGVELDAVRQKLARAKKKAAA